MYFSYLRSRFNMFCENEHLTTKTNTGMTKKIMIIDGGPRKNMNTAAMVDKFAEGTAEAKKAWKDTHWEQDLQKAFDAGKRMAMK